MEATTIFRGKLQKKEIRVLLLPALISSTLTIFTQAAMEHLTSLRINVLLIPKSPWLLQFHYELAFCVAILVPGKAIP